MKKVFLSLIVIAAIVASCKKVEAGDTTATDSTLVEIDSTIVDTAAVTVDTTAVVKDTVTVK
jgi:hypothetical protein